MSGGGDLVAQVRGLWRRRGVGSHAVVDAWVAALSDVSEKPDVVAALSANMALELRAMWERIVTTLEWAERGDAAIWVAYHRKKSRREMLESADPAPSSICAKERAAMRSDANLIRTLLEDDVFAPSTLPPREAERDPVLRFLAEEDNTCPPLAKVKAVQAAARASLQDGIGAMMDTLRDAEAPLAILEDRVMGAVRALSAVENADFERSVLTEIARNRGCPLVAGRSLT